MADAAAYALTIVYQKLLLDFSKDCKVHYKTFEECTDADREPRSRNIVIIYMTTSMVLCGVASIFTC